MICGNRVQVEENLERWRSDLKRRGMKVSLIRQNTCVWKIGTRWRWSYRNQRSGSHPEGLRHTCNFGVRGPTLRRVWEGGSDTPTLQALTMSSSSRANAVKFHSFLSNNILYYYILKTIFNDSMLSTVCLIACPGLFAFIGSQIQERMTETLNWKM